MFPFILWLFITNEQLHKICEIRDKYERVEMLKSFDKEYPNCKDSVIRERIVEGSLIWDK